MSQEEKTMRNLTLTVTGTQQKKVYLGICE